MNSFLRVQIFYWTLRDFYTKVLLQIKNPHLVLGWGSKLSLRKHAKFLTNSNRIFRNANIQVNPKGLLRLQERAWIGENVTLIADDIKIGKYSAIHANGTLLGHIDIGDYVLIAKNVFISSGKHHFLETPHLPIKTQDKHYSKTHGIYSKKVIIEDDVWIGVNCIIMSGVTISKGAIIGSNSVVLSDVEPYSIYAGSPAKRVNTRLTFSPPTTISANKETDLPYFYSGFNILNHSFEPFVNPSSLKVLPQFKLALSSKNKHYISLEIKSISEEIILTYENQEKNIIDSFQVVTFNIKQPNHEDIFLFQVNDSNKLHKSHFFELKKAWTHFEKVSQPSN